MAKEFKLYRISSYATEDDDETFSFFWESGLDSHFGRIGVVRAFENNFDELCELGYSAKDIYVFINTLKDENDGEKAYENLCWNLAYLEGLERKAKSISDDVAKEFRKYLWRENDYVRVLPVWLKFTDLLGDADMARRKTEDAIRSASIPGLEDVLQVVVGDKDYGEILLNSVYKDAWEMARSAMDERYQRMATNIKKLEGFELDEQTRSNLKKIKEAFEAIRNIGPWLEEETDDVY